MTFLELQGLTCLELINFDNTFAKDQLKSYRLFFSAASRIKVTEIMVHLRKNIAFR